MPFIASSKFSFAFGPSLYSGFIVLNYPSQKGKYSILNQDNPNDRANQSEPGFPASVDGVQSNEEEPHKSQPNHDNSENKFRHFIQATKDWARIEWEKNRIP